MDKQDLIAFTEEIAACFEAGEIRAPVHLHGGSEEPLIEIFKDVKPEDWVFSTHRSHYHALLKGVPPELVKAEILAGRSMHLNFKDHRFFTSAIVGGCLPIALGVAMGIKRRGGSERVWCFVGDMGSRTGIYHEVERYATGHNVPLLLVEENNWASVNTPTNDVWGWNGHSQQRDFSYLRTYPHAGTGVKATFV